jgi:hypothetical protein
MDFLDLIPIVPPGLPGERSSQLTPSQRFGAGVASTLLPAVNFLLVLLTGFAAHVTTALVLMPLASAGLAYLVGRLLATPVAWALVFALGCGAFCFIGNSGALMLALFLQFFRDF